MSDSKGTQPVALAAVAVVNVQVHANARVIANFAWQHLKAASTFRDQVLALEAANSGRAFGVFFEDIRSYGSACIMSTAASLEALVNEFFINPEGPLRRQLKDFDTDFSGRGGIEWKAPLEKYQVALDMLGQARMNQQSPSFRNAWALLDLRNALVHYKPTWDPDRQRKVELVDVLFGQYELSTFPDAGADFVTMRTMSGGCMNWVIAAALAFLRDFDSRTRLDDHKMSAFWRFEA